MMALLFEESAKGFLHVISILHQLHVSIPHFAHAIYYGGGYKCVYDVATRSASSTNCREYVCGGLGHPLAGPAPCIHTHLHRLATIRCEKSGLVSFVAYDELYVTEISYRDDGIGSQWGFSLVSRF